MVLAQLVKRSRPISVVRSSNPVIGDFYRTIIYSIEETEIKKKGPGMVHLKMFSLKCWRTMVSCSNTFGDLSMILSMGLDKCEKSNLKCIDCNDNLTTKIGGFALESVK